MCAASEAGTNTPTSMLLSTVFCPRTTAVVTPLWHGTQLARAATLGTWQLLPSLGHLAYLLLWVAAGTAVASWRFRIRLTG